MNFFIITDSLTVVCDSIEKSQVNNLIFSAKNNVVAFAELDKFRLKFKRMSEKAKYYELVRR